MDDISDSKEDSAARAVHQKLEELRWEHEEEEEELRAIAAVGLVVYGLEQARQHRAKCRFERRLYLTRPDLLPNPRADTPWQALYESQNDHAFITTMGFDVAAFN